MLRKLLPIYENSILFPSRPDHPSEQLHLFYDEHYNEWVGIPKIEISEKELNLLKTLYEFMNFPPPAYNTAAKSWHEFLFSNGLLPTCNSEAYFRFIHFHFQGDRIDQIEVESALKGFFTDDVIIIWENSKSGIVIEERKEISLSEKELISMSETLESDFYVKITYYIGKFHPASNQLRMLFRREIDYFSFGQKNLSSTNIYTFERVFPSYLAHFLPDDLTIKVNQELGSVFQEEPEMFSTIKAFLENNLNASMTAKKLYIHRNTLQYRIDKFVEKTGIGLKDFHGAFTVFLACLLFENSQDKNNMPKM